MKAHRLMAHRSQSAGPTPIGPGRPPEAKPSIIDQSTFAFDRSFSSKPLPPSSHRSIHKHKSSRAHALFYPGSSTPPKPRARSHQKKKGGEGVDQSIDSSSPQGFEAATVHPSSKIEGHPKKKGGRRSRSIDRLLLPPRVRYHHHQLHRTAPCHLDS